MKHAVPRTEVKQVHGRNMRTSKTNKLTAAATAATLVQKTQTHQRAAKLAAVKNMQTKLAITEKHDNAVAVVNELTDENVIDRFQGNLYGEYDILKDLKFRITLGASANSGRRGRYSPTVLQEGEGVGGEQGTNIPSIHEVEQHPALPLAPPAN